MMPRWRPGAGDPVSPVGGVPVAALEPLEDGMLAFPEALPVLGSRRPPGTPIESPGSQGATERSPKGRWSE